MMNNTQEIGYFFYLVFIRLNGDMHMIVLTGGKTGGHIMPLLTLAKQLNDVCYVGSVNSLASFSLKSLQHPFFSKYNAFKY